jgi:integrase
VRLGLLTCNVTEAVDQPRRVTPEYVTWDHQQAMAFLALLTGMRRGEILGLSGRI